MHEHPSRQVVVAALLAVASLAAPTSTQAQSVCGVPGDYSVFQCVPERARLGYGNWLLGPGRIDYFLPDAGCSVDAPCPAVFIFHGGAGNNQESPYYRADGCEDPAACTCEGDAPCELPVGFKSRRGHSARTIKKLLEAGYAVVWPYATMINWQTNWTGGLTNYHWTSDFAFLDELFSRVGDPTQSGELAFLAGLDRDHVFASGMSDGGAQASRAVREWTELFQAVVINEGSWSTCSAVTTLCNPPADPGFVHPPTLITHAAADPTVRLAHANTYATWLEEQGIDWRAVLAPSVSGTTVSLDVGHECDDQDPSDYYCIESDDTVVVGGAAHDWLFETPNEHVGFFDRFL